MTFRTQTNKETSIQGVLHRLWLGSWGGSGGACSDPIIVSPMLILLPSLVMPPAAERPD